MGRVNTGMTLNGYSYADSQVVYNGVDLPGVTAFELTRTQSKQNNYGTGRMPVSRSRGRVENTGSITMDYATQRILTNLSATGLLGDLPAGVLVISLEAGDGSKEVVTVTGLEFTTDSIAGTEGDNNIATSTDVIFSTFTKLKI
ncbi:MAG: hypothetical protein SNF86_06695 [Rikenellaceae bacterium]